jgi:hypothetical protein
MVVKRTCKAQRADGQPCRAAPLVGSEFCSVHDPANAEAIAEARRLGGMRRKREVTVAGAYDFPGLTSVPEIRRLLDIAAVDVLGLENGVARIRAMIALALAAAKLLEVGELEEHIAALEAAKHQHDERSVYDERDELGDSFPVGDE